MPPPAPRSSPSADLKLPIFPASPARVSSPTEGTPLPPPPPPPPRTLPPPPFKPTVLSLGSLCCSSRPLVSPLQEPGSHGAVREPVSPEPSSLPRGPAPDSAAGSPAAPRPSPAAPAAAAPRLKSVVVGVLATEEEKAEAAPHLREDDRRGVGHGVGWETVGPRRRPRHVPAPQRHPRPYTEREAAFRRKLHGLCFRCFSPRHFAKDCRDRIRCLNCRCSGHRARDCEDHLATSIEHDAALPRAPPPARRPDGSSSWAEIAAPRTAPHSSDRHLASKPKELAGLAPASLTAPSDAMQNLQEQAALLRAEQEQATLLREELRGLVASQLEELLSAQLKLQGSVQGLMERAGNLLERAEAALERLSLPPAVLQVEPTPSLSSGGNADCADGGIVRFGCYSPRSVSLSASLALDSTPTSIAASEHVSPVMQGPPMKDPGVEMFLALEELGGSDTPSPEEKIAKVMAQFDAIEPQEKTLAFSMKELCREIADMPKDKQLGWMLPLWPSDEASGWTRRTKIVAFQQPSAPSLGGRSLLGKSQKSRAKRKPLMKSSRRRCNVICRCTRSSAHRR